MNHTIYQIAEQVKIRMDGSDDLDLFIELFSEQLIGECINVVAAERNPSNLNYKPSERFVDALRQHFGVY